MLVPVAAVRVVTWLLGRTGTLLTLSTGPIELDDGSVVRVGTHVLSVPREEPRIVGGGIYVLLVFQLFTRAQLIVHDGVVVCFVRVCVDVLVYIFLQLLVLLGCMPQILLDLGKARESVSILVLVGSTVALFPLLLLVVSLHLQVLLVGEHI